MKKRRFVSSALVIAMMITLLFPVRVLAGLTYVAGDYLYEIVGSNAMIVDYKGPGGALVIPDQLDGYTVTIIQYNTFELCASSNTITSIVIPDTVTTIQAEAFAAMSSLTEVTIGAGVTLIDDWAFVLCPNLDTVNFRGANSPAFGVECFDGIAPGAQAYVPDGSDYTGGSYPFSGDSPLKLNVIDLTAANAASVATVKGLVEGASYTMAQAAATDEAAVKAAVENKIATLALDGVTPVVTKVGYTPAVAGDAGDTDGTNGTYTFTADLSKGTASDTTAILTMTITATAFADTTVSTWDDLVTAVSTAPTDGSETVINVTADLNANSTCTISNNRNIVIQSSGGSFKIARNSSYKLAVFFLDNSGSYDPKLMLKNITLDGNGGSVTATFSMVYLSGGEFTMDSGTTIQNIKGDVNYGSPGVEVQAGGIMTMNNGAVISNVENINAIGYGALLVKATLNMAGGSINGCKAAICGGIEAGGTLNLSGAPNISGNTKSNGTTPCNVFLESGSVVNVTGALTNAVPIGITTLETPSAGSTVSITTASDQNWSGKFTSDDPNYVIQNSGSGNSQVVQLAVSTTIDVSDSSGTNLPAGVTYASNLFTIGTGANNSTITVIGSTTTNTIAVNNGVTGLTLILNDVSITSPPGGKSSIDLQGNANATIILADGSNNILDASGANNKTGICVPSTATVNIQGDTNGTGVLNATGGLQGAGIGGGVSTAGGTINISGGNVTATGGSYGAGIGGGYFGAGGTITIAGTANVTATGGLDGAGIGGGGNAAAGGGTININGGNVTATGGQSGAGIGGGQNGAGGSITINDGIVSATGGIYGAGIGGGSYGAGGVIQIAGGTITATGGSQGAGIGGGTNNGCGTVDITGGTVTATGGQNSAGIGSGNGAYGGTINISNNPSVTAFSDGATFPIEVTSGSGSIINAKLNNAISTSAITYLQFGGTTLELPTSYRGFAYSYAADSPVKAYSDSSCTTLLGSVVTYTAGLSSIPVGTPTVKTNVTLYQPKVTVKKDGTAWTSGIPNIQLSTSNSSLTEAASGTCSNGVYTFTGLDPDVTYYAWDTTNSQYTGQSVISTSANATVNYYSVTVNLNGGNGATANGNYLPGNVMSIDAGTRTGYTFKNWTTASGGTFANANNASTTFTTPSNATVITANWTPLLTGTVSLAIDATTGQVTASASGGNTGTTGTRTYTWSGGAAGTGATKTPTPGTATTCTLTTSGSSGSINASVTVYNVTVTESGNTGTDDASIASAYGKVGDNISIAYMLDSSGTQSNTLTFSGAASNPASVSTSGSGTATYVITASDAASNGTVTLNAIFSHSDTPTYALTINGGGIGASGAGSYASGSVVPIDAGTKSGYTFNNWTSTNGGTFGDASSASTTFTMPGNAAIITANWTQITNTVTISVYKDDLVWTGSGKTFTLKAGSTSYADLAAIPNGTFEIYDGAVDTGVPITVSGADASARVDYYTVSLARGTGIATVTGNGIYVKGSSVSINAAVSSGYTWSKWIQTTGGADVSTTQNYHILNITAPLSYTANATQNNTGSGGGNDGDGGSHDSTPAPTPTPTPTHVPIIVDDNNYYIGDVAVKDNTATITVDQAEFDKQLAAAKYSVVIPVTSEASTVEAQLIVKNVQDMNEKGVPLSIQTGNISYNIPASSINTKAILSALDANDPSLAPLNVIIKTNVDSASQALINSAVKATGAEEVAPALQFEITASYNGKIYNVENFDHFVSRSIEITAEQAQQTTTAIVIDPDGAIRHAPTFVYQKDGKWYAQINSLTNSTYALIFNQMSFSDAEGKWYQSVVKEMGSRKIINGVGNNDFAGDKAITRAEFAAIVVRALGLPANGTAAFSDVKSDSWYSGAVATAAKYGIVSGIGNNKFAPDANITREEAMQMIYNAGKLTPYVAVNGADNTKDFIDYGMQSVWATPAVDFNINNGFIQGYEGQFNPKSNITRAETSAVVLRLLQKSGLVDVRTKLY